LSEFEQKVLKSLEEINSKLDFLLKGVSSGSAPTPVAAPTTQTSTEVSEVSRPKPSELVERQKEEARMEEKPPVEGRRICPDCGGTSFATHEDKSQVLHQMGGVKIYAKRYVCKKCGYEY